VNTCDFLELHIARLTPSPFYEVERLVLDTTGNVLGRQAHLPYGEDFGESGTQEKHHFTTYERDTESGSDYAVNRHESSGIGRFFQVDALPGSTANPQSLNRFVYAGDDPVNRTDPLGRGWVLKFICSGGDGCRFVWVVDPGSLTPTTPIPPIVLPSVPSINPGGGVGQGPSTAPIPGDLRKRLSKALDKNGCGDFVKKLIDEVAKETGRPAASNSILDLFDKIAGPGGGGYVLSPQPLVLGGRAAGGTIAGSMGNIGVPGATPPTVIISPEIYFNPIFMPNAQSGYAATALHETIHLAASQGFYDDLQLADSAFSVLKDSLSQAEIDKYNHIDRKDPFSASRWWDHILNQRCN
jgi:RHS repeat-associated protein